MAVKKTSVKKLYRLETDRVIGGVCSGLGEYFNLDPSLIRLIFVVLAFAGGSGLPLYLVLWVILPKKSNLDMSTEEVINDNTREIKDKTKTFEAEVKEWSRDEDLRQYMGVALLVLGMIFLVKNLGLANFFPFDELWPIVLVLFGVVFLSRRHGRK